MQPHAHVETGFVDACGAPLYYEIAGAGRSLVLLHEGLADCRMYDRQFGAFAEHYRTVRYDLHGFGRSGTPAEAYRHDEALLALLDRLGIERAAILGMSLGGKVAIDFALTHPQRVGALLLLAAGIGGYPPSESTLTLAAPMAEAFKAGDFERAVDLSVRLWVDGPQRRPEEVDPAVRERLRSLYIEVLRRSREGGRQADDLDPPAYGRLREIHAPTLIVVGSGDLPDLQAGAALLERSIEGARRVVLPRVAHLFNVEIPDETNRIVLDFLRERYAA